MYFLRTLKEAPNIQKGIRDHAEQCIQYHHIKERAFLQAYDTRRLNSLDEGALQQERRRILQKGRQVGYRAVEEGIDEIQSELDPVVEEQPEPCTPTRRRRKSTGHVETGKALLATTFRKIRLTRIHLKSRNYIKVLLASLRDIVTIALSSTSLAPGSSTIMNEFRTNQEKDRTLGSHNVFPESLKLRQHRLASTPPKATSATPEVLSEVDCTKAPEYDAQVQ
ncbi:hypothetical protein BC832DRAFT_594860 [Gaertneriomyces semiglobifer]|nr:hypothetical protein BC832DRAFT_594860 [Gaertneriomyces semiglobifer]